MKEYLTFRLYGPLASWGQAAVGGDRPTGLCPTRSAVLGLLGAALGIKREEELRLSELQESVTVAIKQTVPTSLLRDYHTTQVPSHSNKIIHRTRKSELGEDKLNTILSSRDYRCDGLWIVALSLTNAAKFALHELKQALNKPVYTLSLGRKSCPLALPLSPRIVQTEKLKQALDTEFPPLMRSHKEDSLRLNANDWVSYFWEGDKNEFDESGVLTTQPWDEPVNRERWQFKQRVMHQISIREGKHVSV
ncbi:type I-E CRISPR-associated protein Cas5/CasD [Alteromonas sp. KS69]|jgi:CRISPR system Cascade subunit CasD|uniref:type I-E CRISPR-associated protein Cas5/CasD n=1 Tax=Alteromonas sp. KS69 TaxID=2109917 RepID=UPI000F88D69F|nr:type I-E CRISPR-associated protein Cas5/CasD [Alteromonas sp. KS69]RUP82357.1 type I-E CRISPR-associated protein Cas5/CasD [Alteromonas sp. KS69]|tara:strand:+ start:21568 stop:22314 length:747 start_codon:yes stop_codon:yes gene_type:complete